MDDVGPLQVMTKKIGAFVSNVLDTITPRQQDLSAPAAAPAAEGVVETITIVIRTPANIQSTTSAVWARRVMPSRWTSK